MSVATEPIMRARGINKVFGATHALRGVDFDVTPGTVTALFGENGAGKSTLMKILAGIEAPTTGTLELDGEPVEIKGPRDAADRGIAIIHQELSLFPNLSIADNVFMARERLRNGVMVDQQREREITATLMERLDEPLDSETPVGDLRVGQQQIVEIARALAQEARMLIMDEPTSALSVAEVDVLFRVIRELTASGVAIVYISHHIEEALEIADRVVVFRDGSLVAEAAADDVGTTWVIEKMVGRNPDDLFPDEHSEAREPRLEVEGLIVSDPRQPRPPPRRRRHAHRAGRRDRRPLRADGSGPHRAARDAGRTSRRRRRPRAARRAADRADLDPPAPGPRHRPRPGGPSARRSRPADVRRPEHDAGEPVAVRARGVGVRRPRERRRSPA